MKTLKFIIILLLSVLIYSCEDTNMPDYKEDFIVEALLTVGEPIKNITVMRSQPINQLFNYDSSMVRDAEVKIIGDGQVFTLKFRPKEEGSLGYFAEDSSYKIKPLTTYSLEINLSNGTKITGITTTPTTTFWTYQPGNIIQYPKDTVKLPVGDSLSWNRVSDTTIYMLSIQNLDTANYGIYLDPPTQESNRRIYKPLAGNNQYRERVVIFPMLNNKTPVVWTAFRWFGKHKLKLYVPDPNFLKWFLQSQAKGEADPLLQSVEGAFGYFGSTSFIEYNFFLLKNQP